MHDAHSCSESICDMDDDTLSVLTHSTADGALNSPLASVHGGFDPASALCQEVEMRCIVSSPTQDEESLEVGLRSTYSLVDFLHEDILWAILLHLGPQDLARIVQTCSKFSIANSNRLWALLCQKTFGEDVDYLRRFCQSFTHIPHKMIYKMMSTLRLELEFTSGARAGLSHTVPQHQVTKIGRSRNNTCIIEDQMVSRFHCAITYHDSQFWVRDVGGVNGTFVNGSCLPHHVDTPLRFGDNVVMGSTCFVVQPRLLVRERVCLVLSGLAHNFQLYLRHRRNVSLHRMLSDDSYSLLGEAVQEDGAAMPATLMTEDEDVGSP